MIYSNGNWGYRKGQHGDQYEIIDLRAGEQGIGCILKVVAPIDKYARVIVDHLAQKDEENGVKTDPFTPR